MKLTKFGTLVNKTTYLFTSIRDSNIFRECAKILELPKGGGRGKIWGSILENPEGRMVWIFSGTTQSVKETWICMSSYGWFRGKWVKLPGARKLKYQH